jgi:hypothetical protein
MQWVRGSNPLGEAQSPSSAASQFFQFSQSESIIDITPKEKETEMKLYLAIIKSHNPENNMTYIAYARARYPKQAKQKVQKMLLNKTHNGMYILYVDEHTRLSHEESCFANLHYELQVPYPL